MIQRQLGERLILVEGAFDRLTLLAAGFRATDVVALVGTAAQPELVSCSGEKDHPGAGC